MQQLNEDITKLIMGIAYCSKAGTTEIEDWDEKVALEYQNNSGFRSFITISAALILEAIKRYEKRKEETTKHEKDDYSGTIY